MYLTTEEEKMLRGEYGEPIRKAMEILTALGDINNAERLIEIKSAHIAGLSYKTHGDAGLKYAEDMVKAHASVRVLTTLNVLGVDRVRWRKMGLPEDWSKKQLKILKAYEKMGCIASCSCTPYYHGIIPRFREHIAWAESSAVVFANSFLGARDNREGGISALASALTGRTPLYGYHIKENRYGDYLIEVNVEIEGVHDFSALGYFVGKLVGNAVPVFQGLPKDAPIECWVALGAALASSGAVAIYHAIGVTPEAPTVEEAFGGEKPKDRIEIGMEEIKRAYEELTSANDDKVDYVAIGCPHCSLRQIKEVAELLRGKKVHKDTRLWVHTSWPIRALTEKLGYVRIIEKAGGIVTSDMCTVLGCVEALNLNTAATNSAKLAFYAPGSNKLKVWFGSVKECVNAAIKGKWE